MLDTMYSLSVAKSKTKEASDKVHFQSLEGQSIEAIGQIICKETWSPHSWRHGYRANKNWLYANFIALDFDNGFPLTETQKICHDLHLTFLIGTTKSHQMQKTSASGKISLPQDRYRLLIFTESGIMDRETYRNTMDYFAFIFPVDESCKDFARYFFPCKEIVASGSGALQRWLPLSHEERAARAERKKKHDEYIEAHKGLGIIPRWVLIKLRTEPVIGTRHLTCYRIGAELFKLGFTEEYIFELIGQSKLSEIGENDYKRAARNGIKASSHSNFLEEWEV